MPRMAATITLSSAIVLVIALQLMGQVSVVEGGCEYHKNCASCVADTTCGWCGNDPFHAGGYGFTLEGDHHQGNPFVPYQLADNTAEAVLMGGIGKVKLEDGSGTSTKVLGLNTVFTKQFRGQGSHVDATTFGGPNPFNLRVYVAGNAVDHQVLRVVSDTEMHVEKNMGVQFTDWIPFTLGTPRGTGALKYGSTSHEVVLPNSATKEQLTIVCKNGNNNLPADPDPHAAAPDAATGPACKFSKELKPGYWLVLDQVNPPVHRVITSIKSDTELTVDADFSQADALASSSLAHSGTDLAAPNTWTYVACPPRIGKIGMGIGTIETHHDQTSDFAASGSILDNSGQIMRCSGACTLKKHRLVGRGTRFETQFGKEAVWSKAVSGGYFGQGPWVTTKINNDWETQKVLKLGQTGTYAEYILVLENSFSEPLLQRQHWHWYTMLSQGNGRIRSYNRRVVSNRWSNTEFSSNSGEGTTEGFYGNTRFLTQLRTGFTITAAGQTRMVNSILSDVEITIDRPFTLGNREFIKATGSQATADSLYVRGLTRLSPLWPRGVTVQLIVTKGLQSSVTTPVKYKYHVWWSTFKHTDDGDANAFDDACTTTNINNNVDCGITAAWDSWKQLEDKELQKTFGVYIKWKRCAIGAGTSGSACATPLVARLDEWRLHIADIENVDYYISTEGERFQHDDNANPPVCYNFGKCLPITSTAVTIEESQRRPQLTAPGLVTYAGPTGTNKFKLTSAQDPNDGNRNAKFTTDVEAGDIIRILVDGEDGSLTTHTKHTDIRVIRVISDTELISDYNDKTTSIGPWNYRVLKCAAGRIHGANHQPVAGTYLPQNTKGIAPDDHQFAYLPHPQLNFYHTWSYKFCEVDPGCCGFKVSSIVDPEQFAYYAVKPDHSNYNLRVHAFTVNDNLDMYTRRGDDGGGRPDTTNYHLTSVRESVPWAIDEDEYDFACLTNTLSKSVMGGDTAVANPEEAYHLALGHYIQEDKRPNCEHWVVGLMGDNHYPQTVGASEYGAYFSLEFNFPDFGCEDSGEAAQDYNGFPLASHKTKCVQNDLRFVRDATVVLNNDDAPRWVVRLTETKKRDSGKFVKWRVEGGKSYPDAQRSGAVWWYRKVHIADGFETNFIFQVTNPSQCGREDKICDGADGFAFVVHNDARQEDGDYTTNTGMDCLPDSNSCDLTDGVIGCPADGLGAGNSKKSNTVDYYQNWQECTDGLRKSFVVEFDLFYNVERRDPKQGKQHWYINATEYTSYNDNHIGVFFTTEPKYAHQEWGASQPMLKMLHSDDENGAHFGSTPSVPTMADFLSHRVKIRYTRGFTTEKQGSGKVTTTDIVSSDADRRRLKGNHLTRFTSELRAGYEFGYASRVKSDVRIKLNRDITCFDEQNSGTYYQCREAPPVATVGFGDDGEAVRVITIIDDDEANLEDTDTTGATAEETEVRITYTPAFMPKQSTDIDYSIIKEFPGELQVFIDDMDRYVFAVAVEDRDMSKVLDTDGNAYIGFTASTGSKGFAPVGYDPEEVHQTHDILSWNFCNAPGCVPY